MKAVGRNDPCPCRSGHKFKKCCGRAANTKLPTFDGTYLRLRISLQHSEPECWRQILLRSDACFEDLHQAIQACGWEQCHLWHFVDSKRVVLAGPPNSDSLFGEPEPDARRVSLASFFREVGARCTYVYDFGDDWTHDVVLEGIEQHSQTFDRALLDGAERFPPEDCGGPPGFARLREYVASGVDPWGDEEQLSVMAKHWRKRQWDLASERSKFGTVLPGFASAPAKSRAAALPQAIRDALGMEQPAHEPLGSDQGACTQVLDRDTMEWIVKQLQQRATEIGGKLGLDVLVGKATFSEVNARISVEVSTVHDDGIVMDRMATDFLDRCEDYGLEPADLGAQFHCSEGTYRVIGMRPRAKAPVICEKVREGGGETTRVRVTAAMARSHLRGAGAVRRPELRLLPPQSPGKAQD
jgi:hypothetical protein